METKIKMKIWEAEEILAGLEAPFSEKYYYTDLIADYKKKPYEVFMFVNVYEVRRSKGGRLSVHQKQEIIPLKGKNHTQIGEQVERIVNECEGNVLDESRDWMPEKWKKIKKSVKIHNLTL
mgnify:CR=1 FL=1